MPQKLASATMWLKMADANTHTNSSKQQHKVVVEQQTIDYDPQAKTLLNCLEKAGVEVHYHCRDGFCGACRVKLIKGQIEYPNGEPLAFIGEGEILPCCCIPKSDIELEID